MLVRRNDRDVSLIARAIALGIPWVDETASRSRLRAPASGDGSPIPPRERELREPSKGATLRCHWSNAPRRSVDRPTYLFKPFRVCCFSCLAARFSLMLRPGFFVSPAGFCLFAISRRPFALERAPQKLTHQLATYVASIAFIRSGRHMAWNLADAHGAPPLESGAGVEPQGRGAAASRWRRWWSRLSATC
jgi:hypothetical protein